MIAASVVISACAAQPQKTTSIPPLENLAPVAIEAVDFLGISEPMRQFVRNHAPEDMHASNKAWNLAYATLDPVLLNFDYDSSITLTAADTFRRRSGNCLSFSTMFVALAREAGFKAWFQEVKIPPRWTNINESILVSMHVNAVVQGMRSKHVVDVSGVKRSEWVRIRRMSDAEAEAQYYNNFGADALVANDLAGAYAYFVKAIRTAPDTSYIWSNLGVVYNRNGQVEDAKQAYLTALKINSAETVALNNLHSIYFEEGDLAQAEKVRSRVERHRRKNPYYLYHLSARALDERRYGVAAKLLNRAIKLNDKEYRFHLALARSLFLSGEKEAALQSLVQAKQLAPPDGELDDISLAELKYISDI